MGYPEPQIFPSDLADISNAYASSEASDGASAGGVSEEARMRREVIELVAQMASKRASDIHITVAERTTLVRARITGSMTTVAEWPADYGHSFCAAAFAMADASDVNYQPYEYQGARCSNRKDLKLPSGVIALRLQFNPIVYGGRALIIRILYDEDDKPNDHIPQVTELGFTEEQAEDFQLLRSKPFGINVVAGPTGHGKSTTLSVNIASIIKAYKYNIAFYTVEDPPEYVIDGAVQMPVVNASTQQERNEAFTKAIAAALRSNPDRIMIGEIRDDASAKLAFEAAMTGHQVWTTLHSNDAVTIPFRLRDLGVEDFKLTDPTLVTGLISQRLVKKLCPHCARPVISPDELSYDLIARLDEISIPLERVKLHNPKGCGHCGEGNGYAGRTVVAEIIVPDHKFMEYVQHNNKAMAEYHWLTVLGGRSMMEHAIERVYNGELDPQDTEKIMGPLEIPNRESPPDTFKAATE